VVAAGAEPGDPVQGETIMLMRMKTPAALAAAVAIATAACSETTRPQTGPSAMAAPDSLGGSARVSTMNMRDEAAVSPGSNCPSGPIVRFELNPTGPSPARVLPQGLRPTDLDTIRGYHIEIARQSDSYPATTIFNQTLRHEPVQTYFVELLDAVNLSGVFESGTYYARGKHLCRGGGEGAWTYTNFGVN
jgi:hypothetical protein